LEFPGYGAAGYALWFAGQAIRNTGPACVLKVPEVIGVGSGTGTTEALPVQITTKAKSLDIEAGQMISIVLGDDWWLGFHNEAGETVEPAPRCEGKIGDVDRLDLPFASGTVEIRLDRPWREVCAAPPSVTVAVDQTVNPAFPAPPAN
jgi:hypothetical protein